MMNLRLAKKGFTLIELLVVIAIIGILSSVVLASLGTAREKARDATRISDVKNMQLALELYYDSAQSYPMNTATAGTVLASTCSGTANELCDYITPTYIPTMPADPQTGRAAAEQYRYIGVTVAGAECNTAGSCTSYRLGTTLERTDNVVTTDDSDNTVGTVFYANGTACGTSGGTERCYSLQP